MDIYENIIVGNFLFGLGVKMGIGHRDAPVDPISINLLQQTPLDQRVGDVLVTNAKIFRLIEFKRRGSKLNKERGKLRMISDAIRVSDDVNNMTKLSRKIHWYIISDFRPLKSGERSKIEVMSYFDFLKPKDCITLPDFIDKTAREASGSVVDEHELCLCKQYMEIVASAWGDTSEVPSRGCLLLVVTGEGQLQYAPVNDIGDLTRSRQKVMEMESQMSLKREELKKDLKREELKKEI